MHDNILVRHERNSDNKAIYGINAQAFTDTAEANLVDALRIRCNCLSLVAEKEDELIGHILFSPVSLEGFDRLNLMGLAPMAVLPQYQKSGVGSLLISEGLDECRNLKLDAVVVLGHPNYYPKFGFKPAVKYNIKSEYNVPDEAFMLQELSPGSLSEASGLIKYHPAFNTV